MGLRHAQGAMTCEGVLFEESDDLDATKVKAHGGGGGDARQREGATS